MSGSIESWVCPACGLLCDDLLNATVDDRPSNQGSIAKSCAKAASWMEKLRDQSAVPQTSHGNLADWIACMAARLRAGKNPVVWLGDVSIGTARAALRLAERLQAQVLLDQSPREMAVSDAIARQGYYSGSLGEVRSRADLVILCGEAASHLPRLRELFVDVPIEDGVRKVLIAGSVSEPSASSLTCSRDQLHELIGIIRRLRRGDELEASPLVELGQHFLECLRSHQSSAWIWTVDGIGDTADLFARQLESLMRELNEERRAVSVRCAERPGLLTAEQVCAWQYGTTPPLVFSDQGPRPLETIRVDDFDVGLAITEFGPLQHVPDDPRWILLQGTGSERKSLKAEQRDQIGIAVPGWHRTGHLFRGDGVLVRRLTGNASSPMLSASDLITQLVECLEA